LYEALPGSGEGFRISREERMSPLMVSISGVRGTIGADFHPELVARWAASFASILGPGPIVVGRDSRPSGGRLSCVAMDTLEACGRDTFDLGIVPTPTVQIAVEHWKAAGGLILTASHNPGEWNACKFVGSSGSFLTDVPFARLRERAEASPRATDGYAPYERWGSRRSRGSEALALHRELILAKIDRDGVRRGRRTRILIDCVNGAGGVLIPGLLRDLGADVEVLNEEPHGRFPRAPEPTGAVLDEVAVEAGRRKVDFALVVDPDADRCALAIPGTPFVGEEWTLPLVAAHLLGRRKGPVVTNLSTSTRLEAVASPFGSPVYRTPVGEANVVDTMREVGAVLGGEGNGGIIDPEIHYGRDAAVAAAWLLEAHATEIDGLAGLASTVPPRYLEKVKLPIALEGTAAYLFDALRMEFGVPDDARDGLRWTFVDGFLHVRSSATEPIVRIIAEASSQAHARELIDRVVSAERGEAGGR
jgi:phosphomannomutase